MTDRRPELAESLGVFVLVFAGCGAIMTQASTGALGHVGVALTFALAITVLVYAMGHICGAHYNPAITIAFALTGHFPWRRVPTYLAAQIAGALAGAGALLILLGDLASLGSTTPSIDLARAFGIEVVATFILALVIIGVATDRRASQGAAGLAIGLAVGLNALAFGPLTGASMNPARSLGPAIASGTFDALWIYLAAPMVGACAAMLCYEALRQGRVGSHETKPLGALGPVHGLEERAE